MPSLSSETLAAGFKVFLREHLGVRLFLKFLFFLLLLPLSALKALLFFSASGESAVGVLVGDGGGCKLGANAMAMAPASVLVGANVLLSGKQKKKTNKVVSEQLKQQRNEEGFTLHKPVEGIKRLRFSFSSFLFSPFVTSHPSTDLLLD